MEPIFGGSLKDHQLKDLKTNEKQDVAFGRNGTPVMNLVGFNIDSWSVCEAIAVAKQDSTTAVANGLDAGGIQAGDAWLIYRCVSS